LKEAIILAGGKGTRLRSVVQDIPKPMAEVAGKPFLEHLLSKLNDAGIAHVVLATGYKSEVIESYFGANFKNIRLSYSVEKEALGTGGAMVKALKACQANSIIILNGDSFIPIDFDSLYEQHVAQNADLSIILRNMKSPDRYGTVRLEGSKITEFLEKREGLISGLINTGVYLVNRNKLLSEDWPEVFSFEKAVLESKVKAWNFYGHTSNGFFIDIGIPEDYFRAKTYFSLPQIDSSWTLFLDRDGVINRRIVDDYVKTPDQFEFLPGSLEAIAHFSSSFKRIVVVTNQQGIGKGLMTEGDLHLIHQKMIKEVELAGGQINEVFYCPALASDNNPCRKPDIGMALAAQKKYPDIRFDKCLMVGDTWSDIEFAKNAGMYSVRITEHPYKTEQKVTVPEATNLTELKSYLL
jgi:D-glycero-alpha-D-manno-heptose 1-phosphate guanylyltransferase